MEIDDNLSLASITGIDWGPAPETAGSIAKERHSNRRTPLKELSFEGLERLITLDHKKDRDVLVPYCLGKIESFCNREIYSPDELRYARLMLLVLNIEKFNWLENPGLLRKARSLVDRVSYALHLNSDLAEQTDDTFEYYRDLVPNVEMDAALYKALVSIEQRVSKVEPVGMRRRSENDSR